MNGGNQSGKDSALKLLLTPPQAAGDRQAVANG
jgi:hypothetical protein